MCLRHIMSAAARFPPASPQTDLSANTALTLCSFSPHFPCHSPALSTSVSGCLETAGRCSATRSSLWPRERSRGWKAWSICEYPARRPRPQACGPGGRGIHWQFNHVFVNPETGCSEMPAASF